MANDSLESESELQYFQEKDEAIALIHEMCKFEVKKFPQFHEELSKVLLKYLEQPQLVQPFIPNLIGPLNDALCILLFECSSRGEAVVLSQVRLNGNFSVWLSDIFLLYVGRQNGSSSYA